MTLATFETLNGVTAGETAALRPFLIRHAPGAAVFAVGLLAAGTWLHQRPALAPAPDTQRIAANPYGVLPAALAQADDMSPLARALAASATPAATASRSAFGGLVDVPATADSSSRSLAEALTPVAAPRLAEPPVAYVPPAEVPLPPVRPADAYAVDAVPVPHARPAGLGEPAQKPVVADNRTFIEKLFGVGQPGVAAPQPAAPIVAPRAAPPAIAVAPPAPAPVATPAVAVAKPVVVASLPPPPAAPAAAPFWTPAAKIPGADRFTAVYDLSARVVYMPDGSRIEAHSGYGDKLDDPRYVDVRMKGATPPNTYELSMRESLFHGVAALRMTPVGDQPLYGRAGLLAHPYMLGPGGDSNGCVSFKDYDAFLKAYRDGLVKKLVVVAKVD